MTHSTDNRPTAPPETPMDAKSKLKITKMNQSIFVSTTGMSSNGAVTSFFGNQHVLKEPSKSSVKIWDGRDVGCGAWD